MVLHIEPLWEMSIDLVKKWGTKDSEDVTPAEDGDSDTSTRELRAKSTKENFLYISKQLSKG